MTFAKFRHTALAAGFAVFTLTACAGSNLLPDDPFAGRGQPLSMVPINHSDRYALNIFVDKYWAGVVDSRSGGMNSVCCFPGGGDWSKPVTVTWEWGTEEDPKTKVVTQQREKHSVQIHFPSGGPHQDPDPYKTDAYLCVILRDLNTVILAFASSPPACAAK
ncbi:MULTISPECIES: DUF3304 domain-containing protein [unclassified Burkholderia]|uniref:DUF3304 domain-containing protein n=1 Tax=unclassified Burkholderia TaxID=2613784 RepID=UPI0009E98373|nr:MULTISPECIES: DUF3304 domain-containing protein [unclassified Burkholderia]